MRKWYLIIAGVFFLPLQAGAYTVTEIQAMEFGELITRNLAAVGEVVVGADGSFSNNANIIVTTLGQRARYSITGAPASTAFTFTLDANTNVTRTLGGGTGEFTVDNFTTHPAVLTSDGGGNATLFIGARIQTAGGGQVYLDGAYDGTYDFTVEF